MPLRLLVLFSCAVVLGHAATPSEAALALFTAKRYPESRAAFEKIAAADPNNAEAHFYLGMLAKRRSDNDEAVHQLELATVLDSANSEYFANLGDAYGTAARHAGLFSKTGLALKCKAALEQSVQLDPDNLEARNGLVTFYREAPGFAGGSMTKAYAQAEEIRRRDPQLGTAVLGQLYISDKKYDQAFGAFEDLLKSAPDNYLALYSVGRTAAQTGLRLDRGEQALRRCLELTPGKNDPGHAAAQWRLGNIAEKRGNPAAARAAYRAALRLDPAFPQAADSLAKLK
jgi:tetratricopeptide (TPR) repeat protein